MKSLSSFFNDRWIIIPCIILALILAFFVINTIPEVVREHPLFGLICYAMVPFLFAAGGVVFVLAILKIKE